MPVKLRLEFLAIVRLNSMNPERKFSSNPVYKINGILLRVPIVNVQHTGFGGIINCGVLEALYLLFGRNICEE